MKNSTAYFLTFLSALALVSAESGAAGPLELARYNVIWESPSKDVTGQMPLGNGDIAANVCVIEGGDLRRGAFASLSILVLLPKVSPSCRH
jgi:hypothetical protein